MIGSARDDGIKSGSGMWSGLRNKKRCVVIMDGSVSQPQLCYDMLARAADWLDVGCRWYEWTQKGNKIPYYTKHTEDKLVISQSQPTHGLMRSRG